MKQIKLLPWQTKVRQDKHRFKVINCGRRAGKSYLVSIELLKFASENDNVDCWYISPTYKQSKAIMWEMLMDLIPRTIMTKSNEQNLVIELINGSKIFLKGGDDPDSLRGVKIDFCVFDETAFFDRWDEVWKVIRPTLIDSLAPVWFISTPNGLNHFKEMAENKTHDDKLLFKPEDHKYFHYTSFENTFLSRDELEQLREEMDEDSFAQEILGEFRRLTGLIYKNFDRDIHMVKIPHLDYNYTFTRSLDFGFGHKSALVYFAIKLDGSEIYAYDGAYQEGLTETQIAEIVRIKDAGRYMTNPVADSAQAMSIQQLNELGCHFAPIEKGPDSVKHGIVKVAELLKIRKDTGKPTLMINKDLSWIADEFEKYRWMENRSSGVLKEVPLKRDDDACFIAGTRILTKRGEVPIEQINKNDLVYTPYGYSKIRSCGKTGKRKVVNYGIFTSTPNHKIITNNGIVRVDTISNSDIIMICQKQSFGREYLTEDIQIPKIELINFIFKGLVIRNLEARLDFCTEKYGNLLTDQFQKGFMFTIKMGIRLIMKFLILCWLLPKNIVYLIRIGLNGITKNILKKLDLLLKNGTHQKKDINFIGRFLKNHGKLEKLLRIFVKFAEKNIQHLSLVEANTVIKTVKQQPCEEEEVYNLATDNGMYFANGVLVSNCDAIRYFAMAYRSGADQEDLPVEEFLKNGYY